MDGLYVRDGAREANDEYAFVKGDGKELKWTGCGWMLEAGPATACYSAWADIYDHIYGFGGMVSAALCAHKATKPLLEAVKDACSAMDVMILAPDHPYSASRILDYVDVLYPACGYDG